MMNEVTFLGFREADRPNRPPLDPPLVWTTTEGYCGQNAGKS